MDRNIIFCQASSIFLRLGNVKRCGEITKRMQRIVRVRRKNLIEGLKFRSEILKKYNIYIFFTDAVLYQCYSVENSKSPADNSALQYPNVRFTCNTSNAVLLAQLAQLQLTTVRTTVVSQRLGSSLLLYSCVFKLERCGVNYEFVSISVLSKSITSVSNTYVT